MMDSTIFITLATLAKEEAIQAGQKIDILKLVLESRGVVLFVLLLLVVFSVVSWFIIGYKYLFLRKANNQSEDFLEIFWQSKKFDAIFQAAEQLKNSPVGQVFRAGYIELSKLKSAETAEDTLGGQIGAIDNVTRSLRKAQTNETTRMESLVGFLATTGSTAPFIGLFGTVWGIMKSFVNIGAQKSASLATVAPGIAEALIATAIGLMAAIPAVVAYNYFLNKIKVLTSEMDIFGNDFLNIVKRHFFK